MRSRLEWDCLSFHYILKCGNLGIISWPLTFEGPMLHLLIKSGDSDINNRTLWQSCVCVWRENPASIVMVTGAWWRCNEFCSWQSGSLKWSLNSAAALLEKLEDERRCSRKLSMLTFDPRVNVTPKGQSSQPEMSFSTFQLTYCLAGKFKGLKRVTVPDQYNYS